VPGVFLVPASACQCLIVVTRDVGEFIEAGVAVFDPWASVFHFDGNKTAIHAPATVEAVASLC
jgi:hypothetical protein